MASLEEQGERGNELEVIRRRKGGSTRFFAAGGGAPGAQGAFGG